MAGIVGDFIKLSEINAKLIVSNNFRCVSEPTQKINDFVPGQTELLEWKVNVGKEEGSFPISVSVNCKIFLPSVSWEKNSKGIIAGISGYGHTRIGVFEKDWVKKFGSQEYSVTPIEVRE